MTYCILEIENGLLVAERPEGVSGEEAALRQGGVLVDPGPYESFDDACEALEALQQELDEEASISDAGATQALEGRIEARE